MELHKSQAFLILIIVRLAISPVEPIDGCVSVGPGPDSIVMVSVVVVLNNTFMKIKVFILV